MTPTLSFGLRQTAPAPATSVDVELVARENERLTLENAQLTLRLAHHEAKAPLVQRLEEEVLNLRAELAELRRRASVDAEVARAPRSVGSRPREPLAFDAPLFPVGDLPTGGPAALSHPSSGGLDFGAVSRLTPTELDGLPYGLICLDAQGRVVHYNDTESRMARLPREAVLGRNFFQDVAPCTRVREFEGQFYDLVRDPSRLRVRSFDFVFRFRHSEQHVTIVITPARQRGLYNLALLRRSVTHP